MPLYEYYCQPCQDKFEMLRSMERAEETTSCPQGHPGAARMLSLIARPAGSGDDFFAGEEESGDGDGGGCCGGGGGCACSAN